jgi:hypothetical protein
MGFDAIDKRFRKPGPIKLECSHCGCTDDAVRGRYLDDADDTTPLCADCWTRWRWSAAGS